MQGDGNCLFRSLCDQVDGTPHDHLFHRADVVRFMRNHRDDFEPFVEDDISFDAHLSRLARSGTYADNDSIVAFARRHNLTVVIHQLNQPLWQIHGGAGGVAGEAEVHISYHNGNHYNSVRRIEGEWNSPTTLRLCLPTITNNYYNEASNKQPLQTDLVDSSMSTSFYSSNTTAEHGPAHLKRKWSVATEATDISNGTKLEYGGQPEVEMELKRNQDPPYQYIPQAPAQLHHSYVLPPPPGFASSPPVSASPSPVSASPSPGSASPPPGSASMSDNNQYPGQSASPPPGKELPMEKSQDNTTNAGEM